MRRLSRRVQTLAGLAILTVTPGCKRLPKPAQEPTALPQRLAGSTISMGDPSFAPQLLRGFHDIESNSWRWTEKDFAVSLSTPSTGAKNGALLVLRFAVPDMVIQKLQSVTLTATVNGLALGPQQYQTAGSFTYKRDVPADRLQAANVTVEFSLDKAIPAGSIDQRQLGIVVSQAGLEAKE